MTPTHSQLADILDAGANSLELRGNWDQGTTKSLRGDCLITSTGRVPGTMMDFRGEAIEKVAEFLGLPFIPQHGIANGSACKQVLTWNDTPGRTAEEVIQVMRDCATKLRLSEEG